MTHRAETILNAVETLLTGLTTTGTRVQRGRVWPVDQLPAISVYKSDDIRSEDDDGMDGYFNRDLTVNIVIHAQASGNLETVLNQIAAEVYAALVADRTLGLAYVFNCLLIGENEPLLEAEQDLPTASMVSGWLISYEHSIASAES